MGLKSDTQDAFDRFDSINAFLDAHAASHSKPHSTLSLSEDDALYAKKLHALAERGVGGEAETARTKLTAYAKTFGKTSEELMEEAGRVVPEPEPMSVMDRTILKAMEPFQRCSKDNLLNLLLFSICEYPDLLAKLREREHLLTSNRLTD